MFFFFFNAENGSLPSFVQMMKPVLFALQQLGGRAELKALDAKAIELMGISDEQKKIPHKGSSNRTEVAYRLAWARTYLKKYGLLANPSRGIWSLTSKYTGDINSIDPMEIERQVRFESANNEEDSPSLTGVESALAFENLAIAILKERAKKQKRPWEVTTHRIPGYSICFPHGIDLFTSPVYCEIKYVRTNNTNALKIIEDACILLGSKLTEGRILFILSIALSDEEKERIKVNTFMATQIKLDIWDIRDLAEKVEPESTYASYLINPKRALVEETLYADPSQEEKEKIKYEYINKIKIAYRNQELNLFLGAGISIDAGVPLWSGLIKRLLIHMINSKTSGKKLNKSDLAVLNSLAYDNKDDSPLTQIRYIKSAFSNEEYYQLIHAALYEETLRTDTDLLNAIAKVCAPRRSPSGIASVITYNFDDLLEQKLTQKEIEFNPIYREEDTPTTDKLNVFHVHGYLPFKNEGINGDINLVFSEEDYHRVYRDAYSWSNLTQLNAFRNNTCLFIGCSMTDPNLRRLLDVAARRGESPRHYAFLRKNIPSEQRNLAKTKRDLLELYQRMDDNIREGYYRQLGLNIIWIDDFKEIPQILTRLAE